MCFVCGFHVIIMFNLSVVTAIVLLLFLYQISCNAARFSFSNRTRDKFFFVLPEYRFEPRHLCLMGEEQVIGVMEYH